MKYLMLAALSLIVVGLITWNLNTQTPQTTSSNDIYTPPPVCYWGFYPEEEFIPFNTYESVSNFNNTRSSITPIVIRRYYVEMCFTG